MVGMIIFVIVVITILYFITKGMGSKSSKNSNSSLDNLSKEEKRKRIMLEEEAKKRKIIVEQKEKKRKIINEVRELIKGLELDEAISLLENEIPKLQEEEAKEIYKNRLSELNNEKRKEEERLKREKEKEEERTRISNEVKDNVENNRFIETNIPLIAEEGCFVMLDNIEVYEYRTRYGATNYEKVGGGKLYITNKKLYFIAEINAFPLVWLEHIIDIELEGTYKLKITRNGNAIFLESYNEVDIFKMYCYIKTIIENK